ncbi:MAG: NlpC/P60 family protein [Nocardioides sp.]|nr:NlpC/P60 family protein [Nocardioides sp.]
MQHGRKRLVTALTGIALVAAISVVPTSPTFAEPTIDEVEAKVDRLYHEAEQASERYNDARVELTELRKDLDTLKADEKRQKTQLDGVREQVEDSIVRQYQGEGISTVGQVVVSEDPGDFLSQLSTMSAFHDLQTQLFTDFSTELEALDIRREATEDRVAQMARVKERLGKEKATIDARFAEAEELLGDLEDKERERLEAASRGDSSTRLPSNVPASGRAKAVLDFALGQLGDRYVFGAAGPSSWDCSGLTMMAWRQAGVSLPHSSRMQAGAGTRVASSDLQPGDLVFYYSPISHVGIYIGNGKIVHAARPGVGVVITGVFSMPYSGAVRPG